MFTRRHYVAIASRLNMQRIIGAPQMTTAPHEFMRGANEQADAYAIALADLFAADSQNFDRERFLRAAGVPQYQDFGGARCAECGEVWPCSDSKRRDIMPTIVAKHRMGDVKRYRVGGSRRTYTFEEAKARAQRIFETKNIVVSIEEVR